MRAIILCAALAACDVAGRPASPPPPAAGIDPSTTGDASTGDEPRLDLPRDEPLPDLPDASSSSTTGSEDMPTTGEADTSTTSSTSSSSSTGEAESSSSGEPSTGEASSTGEAEPSVCGDGVCDPAEHAPCWAPGWCYADCGKEPECLSDCPCTPSVNEWKNFCTAQELPDCSATKPGGYCDPNGDGQYDDADATRGFYEWLAKCG